VSDLTKARLSLANAIRAWYDGAEDENRGIDSRLDDGYDLAESASSLLVVLAGLAEAERQREREVERLAQQLAVDPCQGYQPWADLDERDRDRYRALAREALGGPK
jgi:hypothetical protein